ncbi:MAG: mono/diheme cytochrome c family protein, partial [Candidatus Latescibacterota bacterium]
SLGQQIIETRLLLKLAGAWQVGNYKWNVAQTDASLIENGSGVYISYIDLNGDTNDIDYEIPSNIDCATCHNNNGSTRPIGIKLRNMNFIPSYTGQNQIDYFKNIGLLNGLITSDDISSLPDWTDDTNYDIFERGRAYIDINCAHCHQPGGEVTNFDLDFRYETLFNDSGIYANRGEIEERIQSNTPTYRMPQLGRSIVHAEAVAMLLEYLQAIED